MNTSADSSEILDYRPTLSNAGLMPTFETSAKDEDGRVRYDHIAEERPLAIYVEEQEIVTLMTLGAWPELLTLGYLYNQGLVQNLRKLSSVMVDWTRERVDVTTIDSSGLITEFAYLENSSELSPLAQQDHKVSQNQIYELLKQLSGANRVYRVAGGVHGCAVCDNTGILSFVEDIGRHNAADIISGYMLLNKIDGSGKQLYCTGRLTSEIVVKAARMKISTLLSRSGITRLGLEIARELNITLIARAKGTHFLVYHGHDTILYEAPSKDAL